MRLICISAGLLVLTAATAHADAAVDSRNLYSATRNAAESFLPILDGMGQDPVQSGEALKARVKEPLTKAYSKWWNQYHASGQADGYQPFMSCQSAAMLLQEIADDLISFVEQGGQRPDVSQDVKWFREDFSNCETALGLEPTFGTAE